VYGILPFTQWMNSQTSNPLSFFTAHRQRMIDKREANMRGEKTRVQGNRGDPLSILMQTRTSYNMRSR